MKKGVFISFEGIEGTGKSTQARLLHDALEKRGHRAVLTEEPGGTEISLAIRALLLDARHRGMDPIAELLLYAAARRQHVVEVVNPALEKGMVVITDRFSDSTRAYQGRARGLGTDIIDSLDALVTGGLRPHLTLLLDMEVEAGLRRNIKANKSDRLEQEDAAFHERVRRGYLEIQKAEPERVRLIDAARDIGEVHGAALDIVLGFLEKQGRPSRARS